jgi:hypothetical protein
MSDTSEMMKVLLDIREDIGGLKESTRIFAETMTMHIADDKKLAGVVADLQLAHASDKSARRAWATAGGVAGAVISTAVTAAVEWWRH